MNLDQKYFFNKIVSWCKTFKSKKMKMNHWRFRLIDSEKKKGIRFVFSTKII